MLKATGILRHTAPGPTEPEECKWQIDLNEQQSQQRAAGAIFYASVSGFSETFKELPPENRPKVTQQVKLHATDKKPRRRHPSMNPPQQTAGNEQPDQPVNT